MQLSQWRPAHASRLTLDHAGYLVFHDEPVKDYHLIRVEDASFAHARLRLRVTLVPLPDCSVDFYVNHWGGIDVCRVTRFGDVADHGIAESVDVTRDGEGRLTIEVVFYNAHPTVSLGSSVGAGGHYLGRARDEFRFEHISIEPEAVEVVAEEDRICLVDVGAAGGLQSTWRSRRGTIRPIAFEPNPREAATIRADFSSFPGGLVIERGLFSEDAARTLYVTRVPGCSSLFRPDHGLLARYAIAPAFDVVEEIPVACSRYDTLFHAGEVPRPDVIKLDVQGAELNVLHGFGGLLTSCLGIELETHVYPIYQGQALMGDLVSYLDLFGFSLRKLGTQTTFDSDAVEFEAYFTKRVDRLPDPRDRSLRKLAVVDQVWGLTKSDAGARIAAVALASSP